MIRKYIIATCITIMVSNSLICQVKNEKEYRIPKSKFPDKAFSYFHKDLETARRVRYYFEIDNDSISYEAKFKQDGNLYSIEFDSEGNLEDVEVQTDENEMDSNASSNIHEYLDSFFKKHRIIKIQRQFPPSIFGNGTVRISDERKSIDNLKYEIIVAGRKEKGFERYEMLFNNLGNLLEKRKFVVLGYDHILY
ncbi:hypothetical protein [Costertonia aggregata]|uniref:Uncharacterized protein n=1 Tax=Costertonia aggregata TaxID=343403 RepID=A0A7H9ASX8_9FLAO|nr:hypothetical protein [Costertonia aggregata]QLG46536.1 hypothetical protein HYG79_14665 [Costertonia aggregata]